MIGHCLHLEYSLGRWEQIILAIYTSSDSKHLFKSCALGFSCIKTNVLAWIIYCQKCLNRYISTGFPPCTLAGAASVSCRITSSWASARAGGRAWSRCLWSSRSTPPAPSRKEFCLTKSNNIYLDHFVDFSRSFQGRRGGAGCGGSTRRWPGLCCWAF